jgi:hypothetical protein
MRILAIPTALLIPCMRFASLLAIAIGFLSGLNPAFSTYRESSTATTIADDTVNDISEITRVLESMQEGITGGMGEAAETASKSVQTGQQASKFLALLKFVIPLSIGAIAFISLQGLATILEGQQPLVAESMPHVDVVSPAPNTNRLPNTNAPPIADPPINNSPSYITAPPKSAD